MVSGFKEHSTIKYTGTLDNSALGTAVGTTAKGALPLQMMLGTLRGQVRVLLDLLAELSLTGRPQTSQTSEEEALQPSRRPSAPSAPPTSAAHWPERWSEVRRFDRAFALQRGLGSGCLVPSGESEAVMELLNEAT